MWQQQVKCIRIDNTQTRKHQELLGMEKHVSLVVNGQVQRRFLTTPGLDTELILGFLSVDREIKSAQNVTFMGEEAGVISVALNLYEGPACIVGELSGPLGRDALFGLTAQFKEMAVLYKAISIGHSAAFCTPSEVVYMAEDLSRMGAWYKAIGLSLLGGVIPPILMVTGKVDSQMVSWAIEMGIKAIVSRLAPTDQAFHMAMEAELILVGFARGVRLTVYSGNVF